MDKPCWLVDVGQPLMPWICVVVFGGGALRVVDTLFGRGKHQHVPGEVSGTSA